MIFYYYYWVAQIFTSKFIQNQVFLHFLQGSFGKRCFFKEGCPISSPYQQRGFFSNLKKKILGFLIGLNLGQPSKEKFDSFMAKGATLNPQFCSMEFFYCIYFVPK